METWAEGQGLGTRGTIAALLHTGIVLPHWSVIKAVHPNFAARIKVLTELPNPAFLEAQRQGRRTFGIPPRISTYQWDKSTDTLILPHGLLEKLRRACWTMRLQFEVEDRRIMPPATPPSAKQIQLLVYQQTATAKLLEALEKTGLALLESPPGSGKTEMGLWVLANLPTRALWITHTLELARQVRQRVAQRFGINEDQVGLLGDQERRIGEWLTVGLIPTLARMNLWKIKETFGAVVMDEVHHSPATTWSRVIGSLAARYRMGVTGTLQRRDGLEEITHQLLGPTTHRVTLRNSQVPCTVHTVTIQGVVPEAWKTHEKRVKRYHQDMERFQRGEIKQAPRKPQMPYGKITNELLFHKDREARLVELLTRIVPGRKTLILSSRVQHCQSMAERLRKALPKARIEVIYGGQPEEEREKILSAARAGRVDALFSVAIAKEGLDIPCLDQLVFTAGGRDPIYVQQAIGRIQRVYPGKNACDVWDVLDYDLPVLRNQYYARRRIYRQMGLHLPEPRRTA